MVDDRLAWFAMHHSTIGEWSSAAVLRLKLSENPGIHHSIGNFTRADPSDTWSNETSSAASRSLEVSAFTWVFFTSAALCLCPVQRLSLLLSQWSFPCGSPLRMCVKMAKSFSFRRCRLLFWNVFSKRTFYVINILTHAYNSRRPKVID